MNSVSKDTTRHRVAQAAVAALLALASGLAAADPLVLSGSFQRDDDVRLFNLHVDTAGAVSITSFGYAGGVNALGQTVAGGGFDTMLFLFSDSGALLAQSDDGLGVGTDPNTGLSSDAALALSLAVGDYTLALTQYDNFAQGFNLGDGFSQAGQGNFTPTLSGGCSASSFCDWSGDARSANWNLQFSGVSVVPEPATLALVLAGLAGIAGRRRYGR